MAARGFTEVIVTIISAVHAITIAADTIAGTADQLMNTTARPAYGRAIFLWAA